HRRRRGGGDLPCANACRGACRPVLTGRGARVHGWPRPTASGGCFSPDLVELWRWYQGKREARCASRTGALPLTPDRPLRGPTPRGPDPPSPSSWQRLASHPVRRSSPRSTYGRPRGVPSNGQSESLNVLRNASWLDLASVIDSLARFEEAL